MVEQQIVLLFSKKYLLFMIEAFECKYVNHMFDFVDNEGLFIL